MITILHLEMRGQLDDLRRWLQQTARVEAHGDHTNADYAFKVVLECYFGHGTVLGRGLRRWAWAEFKRTWLREATFEDKTGKL